MLILCNLFSCGVVIILLDLFGVYCGIWRGLVWSGLVLIGLSLLF